MPQMFTATITVTFFAPTIDAARWERRLVETARRSRKARAHTDPGETFIVANVTRIGSRKDRRR